MNSKKNIVLLSLILITVFFSNFITTENLDFSTEVIQISSDRIDVAVTILTGEPEFTYSLWDAEPWENGNEIETSGKTNSLNYTFSNLNRKPYFIVVSDKDGLRRVKQIQLSTEAHIRDDR